MCWIGERHFVCEADRPRTVRSRRCREHLHRHRLVDARRRARGFPSVRLERVAADEQHRLDQRDELVAGRRAEKSDARIASSPLRPGRPARCAGTRSMPYCAALSLSRTKFTSSIAILSESGGSSSRICRVCTHGLAVERLREEQQAHGRGHLVERRRGACPDRPGRAGA